MTENFKYSWHWSPHLKSLSNFHVACFIFEQELMRALFFIMIRVLNIFWMPYKHTKMEFLDGFF